MTTLDRRQLLRGAAASAAAAVVAREALIMPVAYGRGRDDKLGEAVSLEAARSRPTTTPAPTGCRGR